MITDLVRIRLLGEKKRKENLRLRLFMKSRDASDRILRRIAEGIEDRIDCLACANCCRVASATVTERFESEYAVDSADEGRVLRRTEEKGCVFLEGNACAIYDARPDTCIRFPHVVRGAGSIASRMWQLVDRATYCPIVYNSLEAFKEELGFSE